MGPQGGGMSADVVFEQIHETVHACELVLGSEFKIFSQC